MGADGSHGPKPYTQRRTSTLFLRVPTQEWGAVRRGQKREFRAGSGIVSQLHAVKPPMPVVAYSVGVQGRHDAELMVLEAMWREPLGAISPESLANEGCESLAEFRRRWMIRERKRWRPTRVVSVYQVRLWRPGLDDEVMGDRLLRHLYGEWVGFGDEEE
jgi:hypothetical protein